MYRNQVTNLDWRDGIVNIDDKSVDLLVTDPPYGMSYKSNWRKDKHKAIEGDDNLDWLHDWVKEIKRVMKDDAHLYIFCSWHNVDVFKKALEAEFKVKNILIWVKNNTGMGDLFGDYAPQYEMIFFISNGEKKLNGGRDSNIIRTARTNNDNHPTEKPVNLIEYLIEKSSNKKDLVLDTFAGSFSTAKACIRTSRDFICFEIEKKYCDNAAMKLRGETINLF